MVDITTFVPLPRKYEPLVTAPAKAFIAVCADVAPEPPLAIGSVPVTWVAKLTFESDPPKVKLPEDVTVPVNVMPLTEPVPETLVTVPAGLFDH